MTGEAVSSIKHARSATQRAGRRKQSATSARSRYPSWFLSAAAKKPAVSVPLMEYRAAVSRLRILASSAPSRARGSMPRSSGLMGRKLALLPCASLRAEAEDRPRGARPWSCAVLALLMSLSVSPPLMFRPPPPPICPCARGDRGGRPPTPAPLPAERRDAEVGNLEAARFSVSPQTDRTPLRGVDEAATEPPGLTNAPDALLPVVARTRATWTHGK